MQQPQQPGDEPMYTYFRCDFQDCGYEFDYTIVETIHQIKGQMQFAECQLDDDTIKAKVIVTGIGLTKKEWAHWKKTHELPERHNPKEIILGTYHFDHEKQTETYIPNPTGLPIGKDLSAPASPVEEKREDGLLTRMFQAQYGSRAMSKLIDEHIEEYFTRWPSYKEKLAYLEWYHLFLDFSDKLTESKPSPVIDNEPLEMNLQFQNHGDSMTIQCPDEDGQFTMMVKSKGARHWQVYCFDDMDARDIASFLSRHLANAEPSASHPAPAPIVGDPYEEKMKCKDCVHKIQNERLDFECAKGKWYGLGNPEEPPPEWFNYWQECKQYSTDPAQADQVLPEEIRQWIEDYAANERKGKDLHYGGYVAACHALYHKMKEEMEQVIENAVAFNRLSVEQANELVEIKDALRIATQNEASYRVWLEKSREEAGEYLSALKDCLGMMIEADWQDRPTCELVANLINKYPK